MMTYMIFEATSAVAEHGSMLDVDHMLVYTNVLVAVSSAGIVWYSMKEAHRRAHDEHQIAEQAMELAKDEQKQNRKLMRLLMRASFVPGMPGVRTRPTRGRHCRGVDAGARSRNKERVSS